MESNEIITSNEEFKKVDFNDIMSILTYGNDVIGEMIDFTKSYSAMIVEEPINKVEMEDIANKVSSFSKYLDDQNNDTTINQGLIPKLLDKASSVVDKIKSQVLGIETYNESFSDQYSKASEQLDAISRAVEIKIQSILELLNIDTLYIKNISVYIEKLERLINVGRGDLEQYKLEIDSDNPMEIEASNNTIKLFEKRLEELQSVLLAHKNSILETKLKQTVNGTTLMEYQNFGNISLSILRSQSSSIISTKMQQNNLRELQQLKSIVSSTMEKNSEAIVKNIEMVNELRATGSVPINTFKNLYENCIKGMDLLKRYEQTFEEERKKTSILSSKLNESYDFYNRYCIPFSGGMIDTTGELDKIEYEGFQKVKYDQSKTDRNRTN